MDHDDEQIVTELKNGNVLAASWLNDKYFPILHMFLKSKNYYGLDSFMADSVINDTLKQALDSITDFKNVKQNGLRSWLFTISENKAIDEYRKKKACTPPAYRFIPISETHSTNEEGFDEIAEAGFLLDKHIYDEYCSKGIKEDGRMSILAQTMNIFAPEDQEILRLYIFNVPHAEIAKERKSNEEATKKYVNRLVHKLFEEIQKLTGIDKEVINHEWKKLNSKSSAEFIDEGGAERT